ncbi:MAG: hypothetical protein NXY57DRAFT_857108, partial [Lentinula lateritia]
DIILMTEPWWGSIGNKQEGPVSHRAWLPILPVGTVRAGTRPRVMAYTKRRPDYKVTLRSDLARDLDIQIIDITQGTHPVTTIVNLYSQPRARSSQGRRKPDASERLQKIQLPTTTPVIISGDTNQHHNDWSQ